VTPIRSWRSAKGLTESSLLRLRGCLAASCVAHQMEESVQRVMRRSVVESKSTDAVWS
jgi:hypothetical protein